jgi:hypothetical protein
VAYRALVDIREQVVFLDTVVHLVQVDIVVHPEHPASVDTVAQVERPVSVDIVARLELVDIVA